MERLLRDGGARALREAFELLVDERTREYDHVPPLSRPLGHPLDGV